MKNLLLAAFIFFSFLNSFACVGIGEGTLAIAGSYKSKQQIYRGKKSEFILGSCKKSAGKYMILVTAPIYTDLLFKNISSPEGELPEERCEINNSPFKVSKTSEIGIENFYHSETTFLNTCLEAEVIDTRGDIDTSKQVNCVVEQISKNSVVARGPRCAFKISPDSNFIIHYRMNPSCLDLNFLKEKGDIRPMDVKTSLSVFETADLTPGNANYDIMGMIDARITLQPDSDLLPVVKYAGTAGSEWPMQYGAEVEFGKISATQMLIGETEKVLFLKTPFMVNNNCPEVCKNGFCTSPCDFYTPIAARMTLKKKASGEKLFHIVDSWYQGSLVPSRFLGELSFNKTVSNQKLQEGDMFALVAEFSNPSMTYRVIINQAKELIIKLPKIGIETNLNDASKGLEQLGTLQGSKLVSPHGLGHLYGLSGSRSTDNVLQMLEKIVGVDDSWPPYYSSIIHDDLTDNPNRTYQTLKVGFTISNISSTGSIGITNIQYSKESKIFGNYQRPVTEAPEIKCSL